VVGLSLQQATTIVDAALGKARATSCAPLTVAVLDAGGHLKAFAREDGAGIVRPQIAIAKAWGALGMGVGTRALARRVAEQPQLGPFFGALNAMSEGGRGLRPGRDRGGHARRRHRLAHRRGPRRPPPSHPRKDCAAEGRARTAANATRS